MHLPRVKRTDVMGFHALRKALLRASPAPRDALPLGVKQGRPPTAAPNETARPTSTSIAAKTKPMRSPQSLMQSAVNAPVSAAAAEAPPSRRHAAKLAVSVNGEARERSVASTKAKASALAAEHARPHLGLGSGLGSGSSQG